MRQAKVIYHEEGDGWWADSPDFPSFFAAGDTFEECKARVREGLRAITNTKHLGVLHLVQRTEVTERPPGIAPSWTGRGHDDRTVLTLNG